MSELATMEYHPQPQAGEARPWAFPAPERGTLDNGLTVLRCHRPGQQVIAVEVLLDTPLDAEPKGLDGIATIMARAFSEGTDKHTAEEVQAVAKARLRPDNRAVLVYEPVADEAEDAEAPATDENEESAQ